MSGHISSEQYRKGRLLAEEFKKELNDWLTRRRKIITLLKFVASELDEIQRKCDIAEVTGASVAAVGSLAIVGASVVTFFTGGLASPLLIGAATATATAGGATVAITKIVNGLSSYVKEKDIDKLMKEDVEAVEQVEMRREKFEEYSHKTFGDADATEFLISLLCGLGYIEFVNYCAFGKFAKLNELAIFDKVVNVINKVKLLLESVGKTVSKLMIRNIVGIAVRVAAAATLVFSIVDIVETSKSIHGGSKSEAANNIRKIVEGFIKQMESAEELLNAIK